MFLLVKKQKLISIKTNNWTKFLLKMCRFKKQQKLISIKTNDQTYQIFNKIGCLDLSDFK
jgi:hypothetical protein